MRTRIPGIIAFAIVAGALGLTGHATPQSPNYTKIGEVQIGGPLPARWDYTYVDSAGKRLYQSHGAEVVVIDLTTDKIVGRIADTPGVHGFVVAPGTGRGFSTNGSENKVGVIDLKTLTTIMKADTGANPDAILYEPKNKEIYALNHTGKSVTAIDAATGKVTANFPLSGTAETGQADPALGRAFVNAEDVDAVDVIDVAQHKVVATWSVKPAASPTGMAIDTATHRIFVGGGTALVMMDAASGKVVANVPICRGTDATWFDPGTKLVFVSCSDGTVTIAHMDAPDKLSVVQTLATAAGSRTMALDPATHKIYLAAGTRTSPDTFRVLIFGMGK